MATIATKAPPPGSDESKQGLLAALKNLTFLNVGKEADQASEETVGKAAADVEGAEATAHTVKEVAGIIAEMCRENLGDMVLHPGHATVGVFYLAKKHQLERYADNIDGSHIGDKALLQELIREVDLSDAVYPDRYPELVIKEKLIPESDILYFHTEVHKLQPGFFIAKDDARKQVLWVLRGTHDVHDILTDLCGKATPVAGGGYVHWGMLESATWLQKNHLSRVVDTLAKYPGYSLRIIGHSMGAGVAAVLARALHTDEKQRAQLPEGVQVTALGVATAACMSPELCAEVQPYVTTLVMRYDLVPRFSPIYVDGLKAELFSIDYKSLLTSDLMANPRFKAAVDRTNALLNSERTKGLVGRVQQVAGSIASTPQFQAVAKHAQGAAGALAGHLEGLAKSEPSATQAAPMGGIGGKVQGAAQGVLANPQVKGALGWASDRLKEVSGQGSAATPVEGAAADSPADEVAAGGAGEAAPQAPASTQSMDDAVETEAEAAASGKLVEVALYAPGRLLYIRPVDHRVDDGEQTFMLVQGKQDARFQRIVLRSSCLADHFPKQYKAALQDVLAKVEKGEEPKALDEGASTAVEAAAAPAAAVTQPVA